MDTFLIVETGASMQEWWLLAAAAAIAGGAILILVRRPLRKLGNEIQVARAKELFLLERERLQNQFLPAAAATGKPRGLRWVQCQFENEVAFARDLLSRQLVALVPVTIQFAAIEGSDMEGLPAVGNLRNATAVFFFKRHWQTNGKAVFNMNPTEALLHFQKQYEQVGME
jgi:hypothetical protein